MQTAPRPGIFGMIIVPEVSTDAREQAFALLRCDGRDAAAFLTERMEADLAAGCETAALGQMAILTAIEEIMVELAGDAADRLRR